MRFPGPSFADELVGCEALEGLQPPAEVVGAHEVGEVLPELVMGLVVVPLDGCLLQGPVHPLDLSVGPWVLGFGEPVIDVVLGTGVLEGMRPDWLPAFQGLLDELCSGSCVAGRGEVDAVIGQDGVHLVGHGPDERTEEVARYSRCDLLVQLHVGELGGSPPADRAGPPRCGPQRCRCGSSRSGRP